MLLPLAMVAVVVAATFVAHAKIHHDSEPTTDNAVTLTRTLSCIHDARNTSTRIGTVPPSTQGIAIAGNRVTFAPSQAADGYASQWVSGKTRRATWLAARACPTLGDDWWFVGAGSSVQHDSILTLDNPEPVDASFAITVYGPAGPITVPGAFPPVPAGTSRSFDLAKYVAASTKQFPNPDLAVHVTVTRGLVAASMWETWARTPLYAPSRQWVPAATLPAKRLQLMTVPGVVAAGTALLVTNPGSNNAVVEVRAVNADATFAPTRFSVLNVPPGVTLSVPFGNLRKVSTSALILSSSSRISAALRSVQGSAEAYAVPAVRIGAESTVGLPGGIPATLNLTAQTSTSVSVQVIDARGNIVMTKTVQVIGGKAIALALPKSAAALRLNADRRSTATAAIFLNKAGIAMIGMVPTANTAHVPAVIPQPY